MIQLQQLKHVQAARACFALNGRPAWRKGQWYSEQRNAVALLAGTIRPPLSLCWLYLPLSLQYQER